MVLEFNKDSKKILVSHTKVWGDVEAKSTIFNANKNSKAVLISLTLEKKIFLDF